ncbi:hypothetical protein [Rhizobium hidalgonense]|uniref:hypothetical protein n=1 Tax=Rhizobium hidalgonense TaxID=1538159 RepID=UPI001105FC50|nr:hypothetical protein [Rhizobium hidalgonense]QKK26922.1 hypothetical protein FFM81_026985 [Rhizobium hidalgonense]
MLPLSTRPNRSDRGLIARANVDDALFSSLVDPLCDLLRPEREHNGNKPDTSKTLAVPDPFTRYFSFSGAKGIYGTNAREAL